MADPIRELLLPLVSPWPAIRANQNATPPAKPYVTYQVRTTTPLGVIQTEPDGDGVAKLVGPVTLRCEVNFYGPGANTKARGVMLAMRSWAVQINMDTLNLGLASFVAMTDASGVVDDPQSQERSILEFILNATDVTDDLVGVIEGVTISPDADASGVWVTCGTSTAPPA